jgi:hypothetical protein
VELSAELGGVAAFAFITILQCQFSTPEKAGLLGELATI